MGKLRQVTGPGWGGARAAPVPPPPRHTLGPGEGPERGCPVLQRAEPGLGGAAPAPASRPSPAVPYRTEPYRELPGAAEPSGTAPSPAAPGGPGRYRAVPGGLRAVPGPGALRGAERSRRARRTRRRWGPVRPGPERLGPARRGGGGWSPSSAAPAPRSCSASATPVCARWRQVRAAGPRGGAARDDGDRGTPVRWRGVSRGEHGGEQGVKRGRGD